MPEDEANEEDKVEKLTAEIKNDDEMDCGTMSEESEHSEEEMNFDICRAGEKDDSSGCTIPKKKRKV